MKLNNLVGLRFKERPADCVIDSHAFSLRGGYIKYVANGIYSLYPPMRRITAKIENIIREEMDAINTYDLLMELDPENAEVYEEIKNDEEDHAKKLLALQEKVDPDNHESSENIGRFAELLKGAGDVSD